MDDQFKRLEAMLQTEVRQIRELLTASANAVGIANTRAEAMAAQLAERVDTTAKTQAQQVENTAKVIATQMDSMLKALVARIEPLEQERYANAGAKNKEQEHRQNSNWTIAIIVSCVAATATMAGVVVTILTKLGT